MGGFRRASQKVYGHVEARSWAVRDGDDIESDPSDAKKCARRRPAARDDIRGSLKRGPRRGVRGGSEGGIMSRLVLSRIWSDRAHLGLSVITMKVLWNVVKPVIDLLRLTFRPPTPHKGGEKVPCTCDTSVCTGGWRCGACPKGHLQVGPLGHVEANGFCFQKLGRSSRHSTHQLHTFLWHLDESSDG